MLELISLLIFNTTSTRAFGLLNALFISLDITSTLHAHKTSSSLPGSLELANSGLSEQVDLDQVALESALEGNDGLDEERVGVLEVEVHDGHHADTHKLTLEKATELLSVVCVHSSGDGLGLLGRSHRCGLDVLNNGEICLPVSFMLLLVAMRLSRY